jgi:hypothetical protein
LKSIFILGLGGDYAIAWSDCASEIFYYSLFLLSILVVNAGVQPGQPANGSGCSFAPAELQSELDKSVFQFDQDMNGGWRALDQKGCTLQAAMLLDVYNLGDV